MLAGSPGPFKDETLKEKAKIVYQSFDIVTNRESISTALLETEGFDVSKTHSLACPAFLFEPAPRSSVQDVLSQNGIGGDSEQPVVGFIICGWNFEEGPFDKWPRQDRDYTVFAETVEFLTEELGARVCLMSHSNGFDVPPAPFKLKHGRDYPIAKQLQSILESRGISQNVFALDGVYDTWKTKAIVGSFDMLVSGRVHAAVAALSQSVPTVVVDYGHEPKAHKLRGFAQVAGAGDYVADPSMPGDLREKIRHCWERRDDYRSYLNKHIPTVKEQAKENFELLKGLV
jgi:colanic acid/amylovoran biosynthesis protein